MAPPLNLYILLTGYPLHCYNMVVQRGVAGKGQFAGKVNILAPGPGFTNGLSSESETFNMTFLYKLRLC